MILKTKGFILRYPKISDVKRNFEVQQDTETAMNFNSHPETLKQAREEISHAIKENKKKNKTSENFAIEIQGEFAGSISIHHIVPNHKCSITYNLDKKYRGQGIMSKVVKLITTRAFKTYKVIRVEAGLRAYNIGSKKVLERNGFELEGVRRKNTKKNGRYYDDLTYAKIK